MHARNSTPRAPWVLGVAGLVPFYAALAGAHYAPSPYDGVCVTLFFGYSAAILSFLGGSRWGFEIGARPEGPGVLTLIGSVLPALVATFAVITQYISPVLGLAAFALGFVALWIWDALSTGGSSRRWPFWYRPLRTILTIGALIALGLKAWVVL